MVASLLNSTIFTYFPTEILKGSDYNLIFYVAITKSALNNYLDAKQ
jgi:hypothetical protein